MAHGLKKSLINDATIELLSKFEILRNLSKNELKSLLLGNQTDFEPKIAKLIRYAPNETVIKRGDFDSWAFWIVTGTYNIVMSDTIIAKITSPGDIFGEMSVLDGIPRSASVVSVDEGICLGIDMSILGNLDDEYVIHVIKSGFKQKKMERINMTHSQMLKKKKLIDTKCAKLLKLEQRLKEKEQELALREKALANREQRTVYLE